MEEAEAFRSVRRFLEHVQRVLMMQSNFRREVELNQRNEEGCFCAVTLSEKSYAAFGSHKHFNISNTAVSGDVALTDRGVRHRL